MQISSRRATTVFVVSTLILFAACGDAAESDGDGASGSTPSSDDEVLVPADGTILFGRLDGTTERYLTITPDGADEEEIFEAEGCSPCAFLSPDGTRVMMPSVTEDDRLTTATVGTDGGDPFTLELPKGSLSLGPGAWSPDGERLALAGFDERPSRSGIYSVNADGSDLTQITSSGGPIHEPLAWAPDGRHILFFVETGALGPVTHAGDLFVVSVDGTGVRRINPPGVSFGRTFSGLAASWSPDGREIAFGGLDTETRDGSGAVYIVDVESGETTQLSESGNSFSSVGWSPTGEWIAFSGFGAPTVSLADPDGGEVVPLASTDGACCPVWSPDGTQLLIQRGTEGARDLWIVGVNGKLVGRVTQTPGEYFGYGWGGTG